MRAQRNALLCLAAVATLTLAALDGAFAQKLNSRSAAPNIGARPPAPSAPRSGDGGSYQGGGGNRGGLGASVPGVLLAIPQVVPPGGGRFIDDGTVDGVPQGPRRPPQPAARRGPSGAPPANERRLVPDEVVIELPNTMSPQAIDALQRRSRLTRIESQTFQLTGTTLYRWRIPDRRSVAAVVRALETEAVVASAQPNYLFTLQQSQSRSEDRRRSGAIRTGQAAAAAGACPRQRRQCSGRGDRFRRRCFASGTWRRHRADIRRDRYAGRAAQARHRHCRTDRGAWQAVGFGAGCAHPRDPRLRSRRAPAPKARPSISSRASTGRRRTARASSI